MFKPKFNHVLVEINDKDSGWGKSDDGNFSGPVYREGRLLSIGNMLKTADYPLDIQELNQTHSELSKLVGKQVMWNEGHEAGTVFEHENKEFALIYWWDIVGAKDE